MRTVARKDDISICRFLKVTMTRLDIVGHLGIEQHILVDKLVYDNLTDFDKPTASNLIEVSYMVGGSAAFSLEMAEMLGVSASLFGSIGQDTRYANKVLAFLNQYSRQTNRIAERGNTNLFISLWEQHTGRKKLYCQEKSSLMASDIIDNRTELPETAVIFGMQNLNCIVETIRFYKNNHVRVSYIPNQSLITNKQQFINLALYSDFTFLNSSELLEYTSASNWDAAIQTLSQAIDSRGVNSTVVITQGKGGLLVISPGSIASYEPLPILKRLRFGLGGGDLLATAITAMSRTQDISEVINSALHICAEIMEKIEPFESSSPHNRFLVVW